MTCFECEYFGCYKESIYAEEWSEKVTAVGVTYYKKWLDFDVSKGADCTCDKLKGRIRIYDSSPCCAYFKPRSWTRDISSCTECMLCYWHSDDRVSCSGYSGCGKPALLPCRNGRAKLGEQIMFDL